MTVAHATSESSTLVAARLTLAGHVQGIGVRPTVARIASAHSLVGYVTNTIAGVEIHVEGSQSNVSCFEREVLAHLPEEAVVTSLQRDFVNPIRFDAFSIHQSLDHEANDYVLSTPVPPDVATCEACLAEVAETSNRRHRYPFTSCSDCGPRYSIIDSMPYERERTSMSEFSQCPSCMDEYTSPDDRRFHAQTNACPICGPTVRLVDSAKHALAVGQKSIEHAAAAIREGKIVALKGLGGYQLLVDATNEEAVTRLRKRKRRAGKPLAVMVNSLHEARELTNLDDLECEQLCSSKNPIVIVTKRHESSLAAAVTNGLNTIGIMLPTTPLHRLLLDELKHPIVCTSGNVEGDPLGYDFDSAFEVLRDVVDIWLDHDRPIKRPIDDSVVRVMAGRAVTIRAARGYTPLPLAITSTEPVIALGGHQKTSIALSNGGQAILGPHCGDLDSLAARKRHTEQTEDLSVLYGIDQTKLACDMHPGYFTTHWSEDHGSPVTQVQHHHAHIVAGMCEHGWLSEQVLGVAFDGTGYGTDGTTWGGEFLLATQDNFERVGHLRPFQLAGGEAAIRQPWRIATALVNDACGEEAALQLRFDTGDPNSVVQLLHRDHLASTTTSAGRLFDGIACLILGIEACQFEGQAAMQLEDIATLCSDNQDDQSCYDIPVTSESPGQLDWRSMIRQLQADRAVDVPPAQMAMRFHRGLANAVTAFAQRFSSYPVVLSGGVFQNRLLVELIAEDFNATDQRLGLPGTIPPNDGGLAVGQLAIAAARLRKRGPSRCA